MLAAIPCGTCVLVTYPFGPAYAVDAAKAALAMLEEKLVEGQKSGAADALEGETAK